MIVPLVDILKFINYHLIYYFLLFFNDYNKKCARFLVANNCDVSLKDNNGMTAIDIALREGHTKFYEEFSKFLKCIY